MNVFLDDFVCDHLAKHAEARHLVTLKEKSRILRFINIHKINSIYWEFKKGDSRKSKLHFQKKKKYLKNIMAKFEKKSLVKKVGAGIKCDEKYLEYEVKNSELSGSLSKKYSVQRNPCDCTLQDQQVFFSSLLCAVYVNWRLLWHPCRNTSFELK
jgi:hypothetical protein